LNRIANSLARNDYILRGIRASTPNPLRIRTHFDGT
jgi:hypothetical protein